jgi:hypothetical protein
LPNNVAIAVLISRYPAQQIIGFQGKKRGQINLNGNKKRKYNQIVEKAQ